ncbi:putative membrane protein YeiB [Curtobacterium sp. PhB130]|nr:putative membrane protein YeiB [Curtobacterium sp. PhB130]
MMNLNTRPRVNGLDVARGIAVLGMFAAHVGAAATPFTWADPASWSALVHGRSSILFAFCAGVSLVLATAGRVDGPLARVTDRRRVAGRAIAVFALGAVLMVLQTPINVILPTYAVLFVAAVPFLRARLRTLVLLAGTSLVVGPVVAVVGEALTGPGSGFVGDVLVRGYPAVSWWGIVLAGVVVGRAGLERGRALALLLVAGTGCALVGYGGGVLLRLGLGLEPPAPSTSVNAADLGGDSAGGSSVAVPPDGSVAPIATDGSAGVHLDWERLTGLFPHAGSTAELLGGLGVAMAVLAICCLLTRRRRHVLGPIATVGTLALTLYCAHVVAFRIWTAFGTPGAAEPGGPTGGDPAPPLGGWVPFLVLALASTVFAVLWRRLRGSGPLERLTRWASRRFDDPAPSGPRPVRVPDADRTDDSPGDQQQRHHDHRAVQTRDAHLATEHHAGERDHHETGDPGDRVVHR